jgi:hypothetical protein
MENIAVVIERESGRVVYVTSNSVILPKTEQLDNYLLDPSYQVVVDVRTMSGERVRQVNEGGEVVDVHISQLDPAVYRVNLGFTSELFSRGEDAARRIAALLGRDVSASPRQNLLELTTDAQDISNINGVPEIVADGASTANIFIRKLTPQGEPLTGDEDNDAVLLNTTRGTLSHREVRLERGAARVTLRSSTDSVVADVTARGDDLKPYMIHIEFAPPPSLEAAASPAPPKRRAAAKKSTSAAKKRKPAKKRAQASDTES